VVKWQISTSSSLNYFWREDEPIRTPHRPRARPSKIRFFPALRQKTKSSSKPRLYLPFFPLFAHRLHLSNSIPHLSHLPSINITLFLSTSTCNLPRPLGFVLSPFEGTSRFDSRQKHDSYTSGEELFITTVRSRDIFLNLHPHPYLVNLNTK
jgi:hypothetical protein